MVEPIKNQKQNRRVGGPSVATPKHILDASKAEAKKIISELDSNTKLYLKELIRKKQMIGRPEIATSQFIPDSINLSPDTDRPNNRLLLH